MKSLIITLTLVIALIPFNTQSQVSANKKSCKPCEELKKIQLPDLTIIKVEAKAKDTKKSEEVWIPPVIISVPFCRLEGVISKEIYFELLLPLQWNNKF